MSVGDFDVVGPVGWVGVVTGLEVAGLDAILKDWTRLEVSKI
jgi:hypothetical protein